MTLGERATILHRDFPRDRILAEAERAAENLAGTPEDDPALARDVAWILAGILMRGQTNGRDPNNPNVHVRVMDDGVKITDRIG